MESEQGYFEEEVFETKDTVKTIRRFIGTLGKERLRLAAVLVFVVLYTVFTILAPYYSATVVDLIWEKIRAAMNGGPAFSITWESGGRELLKLLGLYGASGLFYTLPTMLMASFAETVNLRLRGEVGEKLKRLPLSYFDRHQPGEIMSRTTSDLEKMSEALQTGMLRLFTATGTVAGSLVLMASLNVFLTLLFLGFMGLSLLFTKLVSRKTLQCAIARQQCMGKFTGLVEEAYSGRVIIRSFNREEKSSERIHEAAQELAKAARRADFIINAVNPAVRMINRCGQVAIAVFGSMLMISGRMTPGRFQAFFQYVNQISEPLTEVSYMVNTMQSALASVERVYDFLDEEEIAPDPQEPDRLPSVQGDVEFKNVRFGYDVDRMLMKDISFKVRPGQKIAIVGSTGAGKTTLINLLMRFYEVNGGHILVDGIDTGRMSRRDLRANFGMVLQDTWLFEGTVAENIAYGRPEAGMDEILAAAKAARADFFIHTLSHGYNTVLSGDAENISVGQRQLLTIARVVLCNPSILILDEATSSVDTRTEMEIGRAMKDLMKNRTSFVIAHRLSTIVDADLILVMKDGDIVEQGSHRELLRANGVYAELYNSQF